MPKAPLDQDRREKRVPIDLLVNRYVEGEPFLCRATNLSRHGMKVEALLEPEGALPKYVGLEFQLPGSDQVIALSGETLPRRGKARSAAIRFTRLSAAAAATIAAFVG